MKKETKEAVFGGGCFSCLEPIFSSTNGVKSVHVGYAGGTTENPVYEEVHEGRTGHAEVVKVEYDPSTVTYKELLKLFFASHDPTKLNRQLHEAGDFYRSIILYSDDEQKKIADEIKGEANEQGTYGGEVITEIVPLEKFHVAEESQQKYFQKNPEKSSCCLIAGSSGEKQC
jgi:peptide-methionine (S)-S-oxide reductase